MNPYGEPQSARARARVPGSSGASTPDEDGQDPYLAPQGRQGGRASSGGAPAGRASVGAAPAGRAPVGSASVGAASVGSARVGARATVGAPPNDPYGGRTGFPGRAAVARAAVRPTPGYNGMGEPGGPAGGGPGGIGPGGDAAAKRAKKRRRTNILTAAAAVLVMLLGAGVVGGTWFFDSVEDVQPKTESQANTVLSADGKVLAKVGDQNRTVVPSNKISPMVEHAVAAAEDKNFYNHGGIDMKGIARAAWNNFSGGDTQGASTITQQYARHAADLKAISYNRKIREAIIARKLEANFEKPDIMGFYLNAIYFGRGAYGIEAAAQAYFGKNKSVLAKDGDKNALTVSEAAVLASVIKQPEPVKGGHQGYDPQYNSADAKERWKYTLNNMLEMNWITPQQFNDARHPTNKTMLDPPKSSCDTCAANGPVGMIIRHVNQELTELGISESDQAQGGYTIKTTINLDAQNAAQEAGRRSSEDSPMNGRPKNYQAAVVAVNPQNGRVLAYYGGDDPTGWDYAGLNYQDGKIVGGVSPGSTFKIYTLAAAMDADISFETRWDSTKEKVDGGKISNAGRDPGSLCGGRIRSCDLETATIQSYNFPFYWIADGVGTDKVVEAAKKAGIRHMWGEGDKLIDLEKSDNATWKKSFGNEVGFGQYRVVPLEHANGIATFANGGVYHKAHFVQTVTNRNEITGKIVTKFNDKVEPDRVFEAAKMSNIDGVLQKIPGHASNALRNGRPAIGKTGTWEFDGGNGDAWMVGATPQVAAAVWVGGKGVKVKLKDNDGSNMFGSDTPAAIWQTFMDKVTSALGFDVEQFPQRQRTGDPNSKFANGEAPPPPPQDQGICIPPFCIDNGNDNNGNNGNGNGNNGNGNGNGNGNNGNGNGNSGNGNGDQPDPVVPGVQTPGDGNPGDGDGPRTFPQTD
jgi:membrane peptidoglycan carboxypeptidase